MLILFTAILACGDGHSHDGDYDYILELDSDIDRGAELFSEHCSSCHGAEAEGDIGPDLVGTEIGHVVEAIQEGIGSMPAFPELNEEEQARLVRDVFIYARGDNR